MNGTLYFGATSGQTVTELFKYAPTPSIATSRDVVAIGADIGTNIAVAACVGIHENAGASFLNVYPM